MQLISFFRCWINKIVIEKHHLCTIDLRKLLASSITLVSSLIFSPISLKGPFYFSS